MILDRKGEAVISVSPFSALINEEISLVTITFRTTDKTSVSTLLSHILVVGMVLLFVFALWNAGSVFRTVWQMSPGDESVLSGVSQPGVFAVDEAEPQGGDEGVGPLAIAVSNNDAENESHEADITVLYEVYDDQQLVSALSNAEGEEKLILYEKLWRVAADKGVDNEFLTMLQIDLRDPHPEVSRLVANILADLQRVQEGRLTPEQELVNRLTEARDRLQAPSQVDVDQEETTIPQQHEEVSAPEILESNMAEDLNKLKDLALTSEDKNLREFALMNLMDFDSSSGVDVLQQVLLNSRDSDERYLAVEKLRSSIGSVNSEKLRQTLHMASGDYDSTVVEHALASLDMLADFERGPAIVDEAENPQDEMPPDGEDEHIAESY